jgi:hypothetical protein
MGSLPVIGFRLGENLQSIILDDPFCGWAKPSQLFIELRSKLFKNNQVRHPWLFSNSHMKNPAASNRVSFNGKSVLGAQPPSPHWTFSTAASGLRAAG